MTKKIFSFTVLVFWGVLGFNQAQAQKQNAFQIQGLYQGHELINEQDTGKTCYLYVDSAIPLSKGKHCAQLQVRPIFSDYQSLNNQRVLKLDSRITNYHRKEYPSLKTCATSLNNSTDKDDIYEDNYTNIYTPFYSAAFTENNIKYDFFVSVSATSKLPTRFRQHQMSWFKESNIDCANLTKI